MNKELLKEMVNELNKLGDKYGSDLEVAFTLYLRSSVDEIDNITDEKLESIRDITNGMNNLLEDYYSEVDYILEEE